LRRNYLNLLYDFIGWYLWFFIFSGGCSPRFSFTHYFFLTELSMGNRFFTVDEILS